MDARALVCLLALLAAAHARRTLEEAGPAPASPTATCDPVPADSINPPANAKVEFTLDVAGTRNFTCVDGKVDKAMAVANVTGDLFEGTFYYAPPAAGGAFGDVTFDLVHAATGKPAGSIVLSATDPPPVFQPAEEPGTMSWARWTVKQTTGDVPAVAYLVRTNTTGGADPACEPGATTPEGQWELEEFTSLHTLYSCPPPPAAT